MKNKKRKDVSLSIQMTIAIILVVVVTNVMLGIVMLIQTKNSMKDQISERMLDISNTAADMINGNLLKNIKSNDKTSFEYTTTERTLLVFQRNINLEYIYCIKDMGDKNFVFCLDPATDNPGEYGQPIAYTDAMYSASLGIPAVDNEPYTDEWGTFYSAYSPVYDSVGNVAGIVAVDFSAEWYDSQMRTGVLTVLLSTAASLIISGLAVLLLTSHVRKRFRQLNAELNELSEDIDMLTNDLDGYSDAPLPDDSGSASDKNTDEDKKKSADSINQLDKRIRSTHGELKRYLNHMNTREKNMITALASDYRSVYYVDLETDTGICYRSGSDAEDKVPEGDSFVFSEWFGRYADKYVTEKYKEEILNLIKPENIREGLKNDTVISCQFLAKHKDRERYEMLRIAGIRRPDDAVVNEISIGITDVDRETRESMDRNRALSEALAVANESSKAKTVFLSNMSHEIRTPMNAIIGLDTIALNDPEISAKARVFFSKIGVSAKHLLNLINDILDMSRIESGRMALRKEEFSFSDITEQVGTIIGEQCSAKNLRYICSVSSDIAKYYIGDEMKLKQILINILGNAVKFTPEGGEVELSVERMEHFENNSTLRFSMRDTGIGMDKEFIPKIFEAFSQEDSSFTTHLGSTGLGMAITKRIVEMMNGRIEVESEKGKGTTFYVTVTLLDSDRTDEEAEGDVLNLKKLTVLVIEPESVSRDCAHITLESMGIHNDTISSCDKAMDKIKSRSVTKYPYNLILIDRNLPDKDTAQEIKSVRYTVGEDAVILLVSEEPDELTAEEISAGTDGFVTLPLDPENLLNEIKLVHQHRNSATDQGEEKLTLEGKTILVAEDMPVNAEIMTMILEMRKMKAEIAENGRIAVEKFSSHLPGYYSAILMDMRMPEMDGLTATTVIRATDRPDASKIPIIALTANAFDEDVQRSLQVGLNAHLSKPIDPDKLFSVLEKLITE